MDISVSFIPDDVVNEARKVYKLKLTRKQAAAFLLNRGDAIRESMIDSGWRSINDFLKSDYNKKVGSGIDRFIKNPGISPMVIIAPLILAAGTVTYFIIKGHVKQPLTLNQIIDQELKKLPAGSTYWGESWLEPKVAKTGYKLTSINRTIYHLWFFVPTGGS